MCVTFSSTGPWLHQAGDPRAKREGHQGRGKCLQILLSLKQVV